MRKRAWGQIWIRILALAVGTKLIALIGIMLNLQAGFDFVEDRASAAAKEIKMSKTGQGGKQECHPELLSLLRAKMANLDEKEAILQKKEQDLLILQKDIQDKIRRLKELQQKLEGPVKKKRFEEEARLQHLAGVYSSMDPVRAAALLDKLDEYTVTKLFAIMKSKKVAKILANMSPEKAARISQRLYGKDEGE